MASPGPECSSASEETLPAAMDFELCADDFKDILEFILPARIKWYFIGVRFNIPVSELDVIERNDPNNINRQFGNMIKKWLDIGDGCTWRAVYDALRHPTVDQNKTAEDLKTQLEQWRKERKRKAPSQGGVKSKKVKFDESTITVEKGEPCPTKGFDSATTHGSCVYFSSGDNIYPFNASSKRWMQQIKCPHPIFGLATVENELVAVGGVANEDKKEEEKEEDRDRPINKVFSFSLDKTGEQTWKDKYPEMKEARVRPEVVAFGKYLIVLGATKPRDPDLRPVTSGEVLDLEEKRWYTINLPEECSSMKWLSACICGEDIYIAVRHDDPEFHSTIQEFLEPKYEDGEFRHKYDYDPPSPWPCYSLYRCSVEALVKSAKDGNNPSNQLRWQKLDHPHPSVYKNSNQERQHDEGCVDDGWDGIPIVELETEYLAYKVCKFVLSHINNTLVAVGCNHVTSVSFEDNKTQLKSAYSSYRVEEKERIEGSGGEIYYSDEIMTSRDRDTIDKECHVYIYDTTDYSWKRVKTTTENGASNYKPTVAVVDNKLVIVRDSEHIHIVNFP